MEKRIYIGPAKAFGLPLRNNMILAGMPEDVFPELEKIFKKYPNFRLLFVAPDALSEARASLAQPASLLSIIRSEVSEQGKNYKQLKEDGEK